MAIFTRRIVSFSALSLYLCVTCAAGAVLKEATSPLSGSYASLDTADLYHPITLAAQLFQESVDPIFPDGGQVGVCPKDVKLTVESSSNSIRLPTGFTSSNCPPSPALVADTVVLNKYELKDLDDEDVYTAEIPHNLFECPVKVNATDKNSTTTTTNINTRPFASMQVTTLKTHIGSRLRATFRQLEIPDFVLDKALGMNDVDIENEDEVVLEMWNSTYINHIISGVQLAIEDLEDYYVLVLNRDDRATELTPRETAAAELGENATMVAGIKSNDTISVYVDPVGNLTAEANVEIDDSINPFGVVRQVRGFIPVDAMSRSGCSYIIEIKSEDDKEMEDDDENEGGSGVTAVSVNDDVSAKTQIEILVPLLLPIFGHRQWSNMPIPSLTLYPTEERCSKSTNSSNSNEENDGMYEVVMQHPPAALKQVVDIKDFNSWFTVSVNGNACSSAKFYSLLETEYFKSTAELHGESKYLAETYGIASEVIQFLEDHRSEQAKNSNNKSELARLYPALSKKLLDTLAKASMYVGRVDLRQCFNLINRRTLEVVLVRRSSYFLRCNSPPFPRLALGKHACRYLESTEASNNTEYSAFFIQHHAQQDCIFSSNRNTAADIKIAADPQLLPTAEADIDNNPAPSDEATIIASLQVPPQQGIASTIPLVAA